MSVDTSTQTATLRGTAVTGREIADSRRTKCPPGPANAFTPSTQLSTLVQAHKPWR